MTLLTTRKKLKAMGGFRDRALERAFREHTLDVSAPYLRIILPILGIAFSVFLIVDWKILGASPLFTQALVCRLSFLTLTLVVYALYRNPKNVAYREALLLAFCAGGVVSYGWTFFLFADADPFVQSMSVMVMIAAIYLLPFSLIQATFFAGAIALTGWVSVQVKGPAAKGVEAGSFAVYFSLMVAFSAISAWRIERARRVEFLRVEELRALARTDSLTGASNRRAGEEQLHVMIDDLGRYGGSAAVIMFDIDWFKKVNDSYGHEQGDKVLQELSSRATRTLRQSDSLTRWGGEEFVVLLPHSDNAAALGLAERLRTRFAAEPIEGVGLVTASFGVTTLNSDDTVESAITRADRALYRAKDAGRNTIRSE